MSASIAWFRSSSARCMSGEAIAILLCPGSKITATATPLTTGLAIQHGTSIAFSSNGEVSSLTSDELSLSPNTDMSTSFSIPISSLDSHHDLRRRQDTEDASSPKDQPIQVLEPPTSSVPPDSPTNAYSSTAIIGVSSPSPSSYTGIGETVLQSTSSVTLSSETTLVTNTGTETIAQSTSPTRSGPDATSSAGSVGSMPAKAGLEGWMVAALGLFATLVGMLGL